MTEWHGSPWLQNTVSSGRKTKNLIYPQLYISMLLLLGAQSMSIFSLK